MRTLFLTLAGVILASSISLSAQGLSFETNEDALAFYGDVMINALDAENRIIAEEAFQTLFEEEISKEGSFEKSLDALKFVSVQYPEDRSFRLISWQLQESESNYTYKTYLQTKEGKFNKFSNDADLTDNDVESTFTRNWPAHLIYKIKDTQTAESKAYIIFGMKQIDQFNKVKVADVLTFSDGNVSFGSPIFVQQADTDNPRKHNRIILSYGADGNASLNYNPSLEMIVHDNVIPQAGMIPGQGVSNYPDGSYQAYKLEGGTWNHIDKLYNQVLDEAPRPKPINRKSKSIFGNRNKS